MNYLNKNNYLTPITLPRDSGIFLTCAIKIAATASYNAVPSILMVAPMGTTNLVTLGSTPILSKHCIVTGNVAVLYS